MGTARTRANNKYIKNHTMQVRFLAYHNTEPDICEYLEKCGMPKTTVLKLALREYMGNHPL